MNKQKARIAVLVSGGGTNLQAIINRWQAGDLPHGDLALVVSNRSKAGGLQRAEKAGIRNVFLPKEDFEARLIQLLEEEEIDIIVLAGFLKILSRDFVRRYPDRILNVHPSLIPSFCGDGFYGLKVHEAALEYGVKVSGATVHFVNEVTDGGRIIAQKAVEVKPDDTPETLQRRTYFAFGSAEDHFKYREAVRKAYPAGNFPVFAGYDHMQYQIRDPQGFAELLQSLMERDRLPDLPFLRK